MKIFCPCCAWAPRPLDRWSCTPVCGMLWNTFETGGRCPRCRTRWTETQCLACAQWSAHEDWYHDDETDEALESAERELEVVEVGG